MFMCRYHRTYRNASVQLRSQRSLQYLRKDKAITTTDGATVSDFM